MDRRGEEDPELTERFEDGEMPAVVEIETADGIVHTVEKDAFAGHPSEPMSWADVEEKFETMSRDRYDEDRRTEIVGSVRNLEDQDVADLVALLD